MTTNLFYENSLDDVFFKTKNSMPFRAEVKHVTPEIARKWLTVNTMNRRIDQKTVSFYADQMKRGMWQFNAQPIVFSKTHKLLDGQHRLLALIQSGVDLPLLVALNVDEDSFSTIDQAKRRSPSDYFQIKGVPNYVFISSVINKYVSITKNYISASTEKQSIVAMRKKTKLSVQDMLNMYNERPEFYQKLFTECNKNYKRFKYLTKTDYGAYMAHLLLDKKHNENIVFKFFDELARGGSHISNNTISILRDKLFESAISDKKMTGLYKHVLIVKTWNAFITGRVIKVLFYNSNKEKRPEFI